MKRVWKALKQNINSMGGMAVKEHFHFLYTYLCSLFLHLSNLLIAYFNGIIVKCLKLQGGSTRELKEQLEDADHAASISWPSCCNVTASPLSPHSQVKTESQDCHTERRASQYFLSPDFSITFLTSYKNRKTEGI